MPYKITIRKRAIKALAKINEPYYSNIREALYDLVDDPRPHGYKQLKGRDAFRIRVADYRIIYQINDDILLINIIDLGHRKNIY